MNNKLLFSFPGFCIILFSSLFAQSYTESFTTGDRGMYQAQCWFFSSTSLRDADPSSGTDYWVRTGQLTNTVGPHTFGTPCTNFQTNGETLTFEHYVTTLGGSSLKQLDVVAVDQRGIVTDTLLSYAYTSTQVVQTSIPLYLNGNYSIQWRWIGIGGTGRGMLDNLSVPGTKIADPNNSCDCDESAFPVEWTHVEIWQEGNTLSFDWGTASELNSDYFEIQRTADGRGFEALGQVQAAGFSDSYRTYQFHTSAPVSSNPYLYRIKQVDLDGSFSFSRTLSLSLEPSSDLALRVFPNPASEQIFIEVQGYATEELTIQLSDIHGKILKVLPNNENQLHVLDVQDIPSGMYFIEAHSLTHQAYSPIIIQ